MAHDQTRPEHGDPDRCLVTCDRCERVFLATIYDSGVIKPSPKHCNHDERHYRRVKSDFTTAPAE